MVNCVKCILRNNMEPCCSVSASIGSIVGNKIIYGSRALLKPLRSKMGFCWVVGVAGDPINFKEVRFNIFEKRQ